MGSITLKFFALIYEASVLNNIMTGTNLRCSSKIGLLYAVHSWFSYLFDYATYEEAREVSESMFDCQNNY